MKILWILSLICTTIFASIDVYNGNSVILEFENSTVKEPKIGKKSLHILSHPTDKSKSILIIPVKYRQKDNILLSYIYNNEKQIMTLDVEQKRYKKEILKVDSSRVKPPKEVQKRISAEWKEAMKIYNTFDKHRYWSKKFIMPLNSKITSDYGNARVFNKSLKSFHGGTDFRAKVGTPIKASNDGVIVISKDRYYAGGSVVISHGEGIYTCYYHLSKMPLKVGERVKRGDIIGYSGKSGRVTGPHLHFTVMVNGVNVDSQDFIPKIDALFDESSQ